MPESSAVPQPKCPKCGKPICETASGNFECSELHSFRPDQWHMFLVGRWAGMLEARDEVMRTSRNHDYDPEYGLDALIEQAKKEVENAQ